MYVVCVTSLDQCMLYVLPHWINVCCICYLTGSMYVVCVTSLDQCMLYVTSLDQCMLYVTSLDQCMLHGYSKYVLDETTVLLRTGLD